MYLDTNISVLIDKLHLQFNSVDMDIKTIALETPPDNIRSLVYYLGLAIDTRVLEFRRATAYENVRPSDIRLFVTAARKPQTISDIARELGITRQATQMGVQRLLKLGVVDLCPVPDNKRDKLVVITKKGKSAQSTVANQVKRMEDEFAKVIGVKGLEVFRENLKTVLASTRALTRNLK